MNSARIERSMSSSEVHPISAVALVPPSTPDGRRSGGAGAAADSGPSTPQRPPPISTAEAIPIQAGRALPAAQAVAVPQTPAGVPRGTLSASIGAASQRAPVRGYALITPAAQQRPLQYG